MRRNIQTYLSCLDCKTSGWDLEVLAENDREIREGSLRCRSCGRVYAVKEGLIHCLPGQLSEEVAHEKEHAESFGYLETAQGEKHPINRQTIEQFRELFLSLPAGDGSRLFQPGGSFDNQAGNAARFFETLELLKLKGGERVLEVGASFGWGSRRLAQRGCEVVALDVTHYLTAADLYFENDGVYFERLMGDMNHLPFADQSFDLIFSHSVIHHCKELSRLFSEFGRVLRPGGRVAALHECAFGLLEDKSGKALQEAIHEGFNENAYTLPQWKRGALEGGFRRVRFHYFSLIDSYLDRKRLRNSPETFKIRLMKWIQSRPAFHRLLNRLVIPMRILLRPKAWMMVAEK